MECSRKFLKKAKKWKLQMVESRELTDLFKNQLDSDFQLLFSVDNDFVELLDEADKLLRGQLVEDGHDSTLDLYERVIFTHSLSLLARFQLVWLPGILGGMKLDILLLKNNLTGGQTPWQLTSPVSLSWVVPAASLC